MRASERTTQCKRDLKRETKGRHGATVVEEIAAVAELLANDQPIAPKYRDHALIGIWKDFRDLHIKPDLVLIYRLSDAETLQLVRLGSHSELGL